MVLGLSGSDGDLWVVINGVCWLCGVGYLVWVLCCVILVAACAGCVCSLCVCSLNSLGWVMVGSYGVC